MASNYMTSDGVDLDSRYLGINAKAKSASTADNATYAASAGYANSATTATNLSGGFSKLTLGTAINFSITEHTSYTAPNSGVVYIDRDLAPGTALVNGVTVIGEGDDGVCCVVKKGWVVTAPTTSGRAMAGVFYPFA